MYLVHLFYLSLALRLLVTSVFILLCHILPAQTYYLNGDAQAGSNGCYQITPNQSWQNGTVWYSSLMNLSESFTLEFYMNFGNVDANGADGMVFVLQTVGTNAIGTDGGGMGFQGFNPSFGIEFDTFSNPETSDPNSDHVAFLKNGIIDHASSSNLAGPVQALASSANLEDGQDHIVKIVWNADTETMSLWLDCSLRLNDQIDLVNEIFGGDNTVYWGFTGATGFYYNQQSVCLQDFIIYDIQDSTICSGGSMQLAMSGNAGGSFSWTPATGLDNATSQTPVAFPAVTTEYCCTYTDLCGETSEECISVFIESPPLIFAGADTVFCAGEMISLNASVDNPDALISWDSADGSIVSGNAGLNPQVNEAGTYLLTAASPVASCIATDEVEVTELPLPVIVINSPVSFCPGESVLLDAGSGWDEVLWENNSDASTLLVDQPGVYSFTVTQNGCEAEDAFTVNEVVLPAIDLGPDQLICDGESVQVDAGVAGTWSTGENASSIEISEAGDYSFTYSTEGCETGDAIAIDVQSAPIIELGSDITICDGDSVTLEIPYVGSWTGGESGNDLTVTESGDYAVVVSLGPCQVSDQIRVDVISQPFIDLGPDPVYCQGEVYPLGAEVENVDYYVWSTGEESAVTAIDEAGDYYLSLSNICGTYTDSIHVEFEECDFLLFVPNAFTPDGDGINDVFLVNSLNIVKGDYFIFNRWGDAVFHTTDLSEAWTGDVHSGEYYAPDGIYTCLIRYTTNKGIVGEWRGHLTLIR